MPKCGEKCLVYSRVCGYIRPVHYWNRGKKEEFAGRVNYKITEEKNEKDQSQADVGRNSEGQESEKQKGRQEINEYAGSTEATDCFASTKIAVASAY